MKKEKHIMLTKGIDLVKISSDRNAAKELSGLVGSDVFVRTPSIKMKECTVKKLIKKNMTLVLEPHNSYGPYISEIKVRYVPNGKSPFLHIERLYGMTHSSDGVFMYRVLPD